MRKNATFFTNKSISIGVCAAAMAVIAWPSGAVAGKLRDYLGSIDLNHYALSANLYSSSSPYAEVDNFFIAYPAPSSFDHAIVTDDTFFIRDGSVGLRKVTPAGWSYGVIGNFQTLGYGSATSDILVGMRRRDWSVQAGGSVGKRFGKLNFDIFATTDILDKYNGQEVDFKIAYAFTAEKFQLVPQLGFGYQSSSLVNYYYGVSDSEARPGRPSYMPGAATTTKLSLDTSWQFHETWHAFVSFNLNFLPDEIRSSPLVDEETTWSVNLGVAYHSGVFVPVRDPLADDRNSFIEIGVGAFLVSATSNVDLLGSSARRDDLEGAQNLSDNDVMWPVDFTWTFGRYHRLDLALFELTRSGQIDLPAPITLSGVSFAAGESFITNLDTRVLRFGYGFSLFRDAQKDLSLFGGIHVTDIKYSVRGNDELVAAKTVAYLPVIGARALVNFSDNIAITANAEFFVLDFDKHSGELIDIAVAGQYRINKRIYIGAGYRFYRQNINSDDESLVGDFQFDYGGPYAYFRLRL